MTNSIGKIQFIQNHKPELLAGTYEISIEQKVTIGNSAPQITIGNEKKNQPPFTSSLIFVVQGNRFDLNPQDIHAVFPPAGSSGDHSNVLPHIVLKRSTLPWERNAQEGKKEVPWLALILIYEGEMAQSEDIKIVTLKDLQSASTSTSDIKWPGATLEIGQHEDDKVAVIDVPKALLSGILQSIDDLQYLAHVRQVTHQITPDNEPLAVVISNRLPKKDGNSTAYLVSLENRYDNGQFNFQGANPKDYIRLVVLKSWSFSCTEPKQDFKGLLTHLNRDTLLLKLPKDTHSEAEEYLVKGYVPLPHYLRQGGKTFSWYHSPLLPAKNPTEIKLSQLSVRCADQLLSYDPENGLFDTSYAAAWQLGQLLALQDKSFAINLFNWKRSNAQKLAKESQLALYPHLFTSQPNTGDDIEFPNDINTWFEQLGLLKGVPFHYLVPDERMLPPESIRFFWLDWFWVESLLDGAFSIGRVQASDAKQDSQNKPLLGPPKTITGFIMRSEVVSGWPDLQIDGFVNTDPKPETDKLKVLRCDRLSESVLICLFDGEIKTVDISLKPEGLHFGFTENLDRGLRYLIDGEKILEGLKVNLTWKDEDRRVVNINALADDMKKKPIISSDEDQSPEEKHLSFTSAQFALEMVQGAEKVRFSYKAS